MSATEISPLEKILSGNFSPRPPRVVAEPSAALFGEAVAAATPPGPPLPPPAPCPACGHGVFWLDGYGGFHCGVCEPAPRPSFVREGFLLIEAFDDDGLASPADRSWRSLKEPHCRNGDDTQRDDAGQSALPPADQFIERTETLPGGQEVIRVTAAGYRWRGALPREDESFDDWWGRQKIWR